jgi:hypothetical protein
MRTRLARCSRSVFRGATQCIRNPHVEACVRACCRLREKVYDPWFGILSLIVFVASRVSLQSCATCKFWREDSAASSDQLVPWSAPEAAPCARKIESSSALNKFALTPPCGSSSTIQGVSFRRGGASDHGNGCHGWWMQESPNFRRFSRCEFSVDSCRN